jgi:hypothetical protein
MTAPPMTGAGALAGAAEPVGSAPPAKTKARKRRPAPRCGATAHSTGSPCRQYRGARTDHRGTGNCWLHGGRTPNGKKAGRAEAAALTLASLAIPVDGPPVEVLRAALASAHGVLLAAQGLLAGQPTVEHLEVYEKAIERAAKVAEGSLRGRLLEAQEDWLRTQVSAFRAGFDHVLDGLELTPEQYESGRRLVAEACTDVIPRVLASQRN